MMENKQLSNEHKTWKRVNYYRVNRNFIQLRANTSKTYNAWQKKGTEARALPLTLLRRSLSPTYPSSNPSRMRSKIKRAKLENLTNFPYLLIKTKRRLWRRRRSNKRSAISADWLVPACAPQLLALSRTIDYLDPKGLSRILFCMLDLALDLLHWVCWDGTT